MKTLNSDFRILVGEPMNIANQKKRLSKSDYLAGLQCPKHLWLRINERGSTELEVDEGVEDLLKQGRKVGELARTYVPGGTLIEYPYYATDDRLRATTAAIDDEVTIIYEAAFATETLFVAIDILERDSEGFVVTEVKSSTSVKDEHLLELALQTYVLRQCGVQVSKLQLMHLNSDCAYPNLENLFTIKDVTKDVAPLIDKIEEGIRVQVEVLSDSLPVIQIGAHCSTPRECSFTSRCWVNEGL